MCVSAKFTPAWLTLISVSSGPGSGTGRSATFKTSGPPNSVIWMARMGPRLSEWRRGHGPRPGVLAGPLPVRALRTGVV